MDLKDARALHMAGRLDEAEAAYRRLLDSDPANPMLWHLLGWVRVDGGRHAEAVEPLNRAIDLGASVPHVWFHLGLACQHSGDLNAAAEHYREAHRRFPEPVPQVLNNLGAVEESRGHLDLARAAYSDAAGCAGAPASAFRNLARLSTRDPAEAQAVLERGVSAHPDDADLWSMLGQHRMATQAWRDAADAFARAVALQPDAADVINQANGLVRSGQLDAAASALDSLPETDRDRAGAHAARGQLMAARHRWDDAEDAFLKAHEREPDAQEHVANLAAAQRYGGKDTETVLATLAPMLSRPDLHPATLAVGFTSAQTLCDWALVKRLEPALEQATRTALAAGACPHEHPLDHIRRSGDARANLVVARAWSAHTETSTAESARRAPSGGKLRVGYLCAEFGRHAVGFLAAPLIEHHDRDRFDIHAYSLRPDDGSPWYRRVADHAACFRDLSQLDESTAIEQVLGDTLDVLVDLNGYTGGGRPGWLARRLAPLQVSYLGFPGSMGAPWMDAIIGDAVLTPGERAALYDERLIHLPHGYALIDPTLRDQAPDTDRRTHGLPDRGVVFASFNSAYKIGPAVFDAWMDTLRRTPDSVLWLWAPGERLREHLRSAAIERQVSPDRLVFAATATIGEHIARLALADLVLDTWHYGGGVTTMHALLAGVPVLTLAGESYVSRMGASLLHYAGLDELIVHTPAQYIERAVDLAGDGDQRDRLRTTLAQAQATAPLFDPARQTRFVEAGLAGLVASGVSERTPIVVPGE